MINTNSVQIEKFSLNYYLTKAYLNHKPSSENRFMATVEKVGTVVVAAFAAIAETLMNIAFLTINLGISAVNYARSFFAQREVVQIVAEKNVKELKEVETVLSTIIEETSSQIANEKTPVNSETFSTEESITEMTTEDPVVEIAKIVTREKEIVAEQAVEAAVINEIETKKEIQPAAEETLNEEKSAVVIDEQTITAPSEEGVADTEEVKIEGRQPIAYKAKLLFDRLIKRIAA